MHEVPPEPIAVTLFVVDVPYVIGGWLASAVHGVVRATVDADIVGDLQIEHAEPFDRRLWAAAGRVGLGPHPAELPVLLDTWKG